MGEARKFLQKLQVTKDTNKLLEEMKTPIAITDSGDGMYIPNHSGQHDAGTTGTPTADEDIANKKYVDDNIPSVITDLTAGTNKVFQTKGTSEIVEIGLGAAGTYLKSGGAGQDMTWDTPTGTGDVTAAVNLTANTIVQGDDGAKGVKTSTATVAQVAANVAHTAGDGSDHADVATNTAASHAQSHNIASHSDTTATGTELNTLTDNSMADALHRHSELSASDGTPDRVVYVDAAGKLFADASPIGLDVQYHLETGTLNVNSNITLGGTVDGIDIATDVAANTTHRGLTNNPHSVTKAQVGLTNVTDVATSDVAYNAGTWDANTDAATKNAIRDKIESLPGGHDPVTLNASATTGGMGLSTQEISNRAATNAQTGYMTAALVGNIETNNAKNTNVTTNLSEGTATNTTLDVNSSDGTNATLASASTTRAGVLTKAKWDEIVAATTHVADNSQAHSDYLLNSAADIGVGLQLTGDNSSVDTTYVPNILYNTDATPPYCKHSTNRNNLRAIHSLKWH